MAKLSDEQIAKKAENADAWTPLGLPSNWDHGDIVFSPSQLLSFARAIESAARREAFKESAEVCKMANDAASLKYKKLLDSYYEGRCDESDACEQAILALADKEAQCD